MSIDEAARFIQRKWHWFQTVGKFLAKKKYPRLNDVQRKNFGDADNFFINTSISHLHTGLTVSEILECNSALSNLSALQKSHLESMAENITGFQAGRQLWTTGEPVDTAYLVVKGSVKFSNNRGNKQRQRYSMDNTDSSISSSFDMPEFGRNFSIGSFGRPDKELFGVSSSSEYGRLEEMLKSRAISVRLSNSNPSEFERENEEWVSFRGHFANKVLAKLYSRRAYTTDLLFSRGVFLCDSSRMVYGLMAKSDRKSDDVRTTSYSVTLVAGDEGCEVMSFSKENLRNFFDEHPGVLLAMLGSQVIA